MLGLECDLHEQIACSMSVFSTFNNKLIPKKNLFESCLSRHELKGTLQQHRKKGSTQEMHMQSGTATTHMSMQEQEKHIVTMTNFY